MLRRFKGAVILVKRHGENLCGWIVGNSSLKGVREGLPVNLPERARLSGKCSFLPLTSASEHS